MSKDNLGNEYSAATRKLDKSVLGFFSAAERILLVIISLLTMLAVALELAHFAESGLIRLADLLLLFIYLEVIGMVYAYYATHSVPVTLPVLIAITGITRLIILQGKEAEPSKLLFEAGAVLLLAVALAILSWASQRTSSLNAEDDTDSDSPQNYS
jgi:protein PsiE